uniref:Uncharacterized protein n=1 Tax=Arundo donax TaxID=35708 RepID=A0A0A9FNC3_ARUDO
MPIQHEPLLCHHKALEALDAKLDRGNGLRAQHAHGHGRRAGHSEENDNGILQLRPGQAVQRPAAIKADGQEGKVFREWPERNHTG